MINPFKRYKGKLYIILIFGLGYAIVVTLITSLFQFLPVGTYLENQLFDKIQQDNTIDSKDSDLYDRYAPYIEELCMVNLDVDFFDVETNRVKKNKLAEFLNKADTVLNQSKVVFIDYSFEYAQEEDSILIKELEKIKDKLVLPYHFNIKDNIAFEGKRSEIKSDRVINITYPQYKDCTLGYTFPFKDPQTNSSRYFKFFLDDKKHVSVPWKLYEQSSFYDGQFASQFSNHIKELHFILRNQDIYGKERAKLDYEASDLLDAKMSSKDFESLCKDKIVFIGLFDSYKSKYENTIDNFITPVKSNLNGTLLLINAYLNLTAQENIKNNNWLIIFIINFFVGLLIALNYEKDIDSRYTPILTTIISFMASLLFFYKIAALFFIYYQTKLSVGMSLLIFQKDYTIYTWYQGFFRKKK